MAQSSWPFESVDTTETQYSQVARIWAGDSGVNGLPGGTELQPYADATGLNVKVRVGQANVRGHYYSSTAVETLTITTADPTNPRIDIVVLELDPALNSILLKVVAGTPAVSPVAPTVVQTDAGVYQLLLGQVSVTAGLTTIASGNVTDKRTFMTNRVGIWTTALRPTSPQVGKMGWNTTLGKMEFWDGSAWAQVFTGSGGGAFNYLLNSDFSVNHRLSGSVTMTASPQTMAFADRWYASVTNSGGGSFSADPSGRLTGSSSPSIDGPIENAYGRLVIGSTAGPSAFYIAQRIEGVNNLAGKTITISYWWKTTGNISLTSTPEVVQNFGSGGSADVTTAASSSVSFSSITGWTRHSVTMTVPAIGSASVGAGNYVEVRLIKKTSGTSAAWGNTYITGAMVEVASSASDYVRQNEDQQQEILACQRYYYTTYAPGTRAGSASQTAGSVAWTQVSATSGRNALPVRFPTDMRISPTVTVYSTSTGTSANAYDITGAADKAATVINTSAGGTNIVNNVAATAGNLFYAHLVADAEL